MRLLGNDEFRCAVFHILHSPTYDFHLLRNRILGWSRTFHELLGKVEPHVSGKLQSLLKQMRDGSGHAERIRPAAWVTSRNFPTQLHLRRFSST